MSEVIVKQEDLQAIGEAIRAKNETSNTYTPAEMGPAILALFTERSIKRLESIEITHQPRYQFVVNELFSLEDLEVTAYYSDGTSQVVTDKVTSSKEAGSRLQYEQDIEVTLTYYEEGITRITSYTAYVTDVEIVDWTNGSDEQVVAMVQAADKGRINLHDYWNVGQARRIEVGNIGDDGYVFRAGVPMNQVPVDLVLVDYGENYLLSKPTETRTTGNFIVQYKYALPVDGALGARFFTSSKEYEWIWDKKFQDCLMDEWMNIGLAEDWFIPNHPAYFQSIMKTVKVPFAADGTTGNSVEYLGRQCFFPSETEIFGRAVHTHSFEETYCHQWTYYAIDNENRKRYRGITGTISDSPVAYWTRSPALYTGDQTGGSGNGNYWCIVNEEGLAYAGSILLKSGVLPCFVI